MERTMFRIVILITVSNFKLNRLCYYSNKMAEKQYLDKIQNKIIKNITKIVEYDMVHLINSYYACCK